MDAVLGTAENPLRVAVIGSGPAGFYAAGQLLSSTDPVVHVDVFDRLMTPWGLVRFGVAPDHPKIKSVTRVFERTARMPGFAFHGNVEVGTDVTHDELAAAYHAVLYAVGTPGDRRLGIDGEDLPGSESATEFVAWYNGHPDYADMDFDLSCKRAVVIGNGNVALDVARMLALSVDELQVTDIADHSIELLRGSNIEEIVVLGRRGPAQAAFTNPELRELADLELADVIVDPADMELDVASAAGLESADGTIQRNVEVLTSYSTLTPSGKPRRVVLRFLTSPVAIEGSDRVEALVVQRNELIAADDGSLKARPTGETERLETGIVLRAVGYVGKPLPGVPFDDRRATVLNEGGRVLDPDTQKPIPGLYAAGWIKRGPSGVIGTNKKCAQETTDRLFEDHSAGLLPTPTRTPAELLAQLRERVNVVDYSGWEAIDAHERALGEPNGRPRVKLVRRHEQLERAGTR
ncbi:MAG TPA: FAD-dependent oxidoreductase [Solirubrobacteraceae bacterium]|jgi:ferredoxin--NADP+ reductase|nr:FAD-dependent oxidoreductase [Solirubrobacteraceae bacterium]